MKIFLYLFVEEEKKGGEKKRKECINRHRTINVNIDQFGAAFRYETNNSISSC